ncbi:hypothetical protein FALB51S_02215 [Frigidibacter albus]|uniref:Uncharacterized protein n=1 Tax=Frigidibacter mobilis TaxID=1335048 RepID=A0A159Z336_9RHOB|nr:hypothetical protein AKL17_1274 [Frigidibacter mobilis]
MQDVSGWGARGADGESVTAGTLRVRPADTLVPG